MDRTFYAESDIDIYANPGHGGEVGRYLLDVEGYTFMAKKTEKGMGYEDFKSAMDELSTDEGRQEDSVYLTNTISRVFFFKKVSDTGELLKAQVIVAKACALHVILNFHSSEWYRINSL